MYRIFKQIEHLTSGLKGKGDSSKHTTRTTMTSRGTHLNKRKGKISFPLVSDAALDTLDIVQYKQEGKKNKMSKMPT